MEKLSINYGTDGCICALRASSLQQQMNSLQFLQNCIKSLTLQTSVAFLVFVVAANFFSFFFFSLYIQNENCNESNFLMNGLKMAGLLLLT